MQNFPKIQINSLTNLCKKLKKGLTFITNSFWSFDIAPNRKVDQEKFPWNYLSLKVLEFILFEKKNSI